MDSKIDYDFSSLSGIFRHPEHLNLLARERISKMRAVLKNCEEYNCPSDCMHCCYGSILMSYTEFIAITLYLQEKWPTQQIGGLLSCRVGLLKEDGMPLCPFLDMEAGHEHCRIYPVRPLICRVFGTTAAPCTQDIVPAALDENLFYFTHQLLTYDGNQFIALDLDERLVLFEAPFALWCLAGNGEGERQFLCELLRKQGNSFRAVLFDREEDVFFTLEHNRRVVLSRR